MCRSTYTHFQLREVAEFSHVRDANDDFLDEDFRQECHKHIPNTEDIEPAQACNAYMYLNDHIWVQLIY